MPQLLSPDDRPLTWAALLVQNEAWHAARDEESLPASAVCFGASRGLGARHERCGGGLDGNWRSFHRAPCGCECHATASRQVA